MKRIILLSLISFFMFSCSDTPEQKAEKLLKRSESEFCKITLHQPIVLYRVIDKAVNDVIGYEVYYTETLEGEDFYWRATLNKSLTEITEKKIQLKPGPPEIDILDFSEMDEEM